MEEKNRIMERFDRTTTSEQSVYDQEKEEITRKRKIKDMNRPKFISA